MESDPSLHSRSSNLAHHGWEHRDKDRTTLLSVRHLDPDQEICEQFW